MKNNKVLLIGWDAADWDIIWPLIAQGKMPALKSLIQRGVYGNMSTMNPPYSPMLWTSVVTGKTPDKHGVLGFIEVTPDAKTVRPVTTTSRKTRALWNIFHNKGLASNLVGWWPSFPVEPINGTIISDRFQKTSRNPKKQTPMSEFVIHPWEKKDEFKDLRMFPFEITQAHLYPFVPRAHDVDQDMHRGLAAIASVVSQNTSVHNAATKLLRTSEWDFMAVYYDMIDHFCHSFMKYHPPKLPGVEKENYDIFKEAVTGSYIFQDMMLERKLKLIDKDTTVIVMSDHGFESGEKRILEMPKVQAAPSLEHRQFGMFVAAGPNIKENTKVFGMGLIVTIVSGLPRSGTSLMMQMLDKGGVDILQDQLREADISNPKGYYEYKPVMSLYKDNTWLSKGQDKAVKVVAPLLKYLDSTLRYKIIFMRRDLNEIIQSQQKMIGKSEQEFPVTLYNKYQKLLANVTLWDKSEPGVEILYVNYTDVLENPASELARIEKFLGVAVDKQEMINCVDVSLYRNRTKAKK